MMWDNVLIVFALYLFLGMTMVALAFWRHRLLFRPNTKLRFLDFSAFACVVAGQVVLFLLAFAAFLFLFQLSVGAQEAASSPVSHIVEYFTPSKSLGGLAALMLMMIGFAALIAIPFPLARLVLRGGQLLGYRNSPDSLAALLLQPQPARQASSQEWRKVILRRLSALDWKPATDEEQVYYHLVKGDIDTLPEFGDFGKEALNELVRTLPAHDEGKRRDVVKLLMSNWPRDIATLESIIEGITPNRTDERLRVDDYAEYLKLGGEIACLVAIRELSKGGHFTFCYEMFVFVCSIAADPMSFLSKHIHSDDERIVFGVLTILLMALAKHEPYEYETGERLVRICDRLLLSHHYQGDPDHQSDRVLQLSRQWNTHELFDETMSHVKHLSTSHCSKRVRKLARQLLEKAGAREAFERVLAIDEALDGAGVGGRDTAKMD